MASPPRQDVKTFLSSSSTSSKSAPTATTSALLQSLDARHICPVAPVSSCELGQPYPLPLASSTPMPPLQIIPTRSERRHKHCNVLMRPPTPLNVSPLSSMPRSLAPFPEDANPPATTRYTDRDETAATAQLYDYYLEPSVRLLAQNRVLDMGVLRPGLYDGKVGLLPGLHGDFMENYEKPPKSQRAPREDLSPYTAEEKVERRKARAREYSTIARKRQEAIETAFKLDLGYMRSFRVIMEEGPNMVAVVAPDLEASVLYANGAFHRALAVHPKRLLGRSLWNLLHEADHLAVRNALISVVLSKNPPPSHVPCRILAPRPDMCLRAQVSLAMGTQGVICVFWEA